MQELHQEVGCDGFLINNLFRPAYINGIVDQLVPALQARQLTRQEYGYKTLRENLMTF